MMEAQNAWRSAADVMTSVKGKELRILKRSGEKHAAETQSAKHIARNTKRVTHGEKHMA